MARIRTIKPEFWSSEQVVEMSPIARLLFIGLWNFCDDGGNHPASARTLKMEVFPGDDFTAEQIGLWIEEMKNAGLIVEYQADNRTYWHVTGWHHQKIEKPNYKHPAPEFADRSATSRRPADPVRESKGKERKGKEGSEKHAPAHEEIKTENQKAPGDPYTYCLSEINTWARPDNWQPLREYAKSVGYDPDLYGPVADEIKKFTLHWLDLSRVASTDRAAFIIDPAKFFNEKGRKWLLDAKNFNKHKTKATTNHTKYEPPPNYRRQNATDTTIKIGDIAGKIITEM